MWISCNLVVDLLQVGGSPGCLREGVSDADPDTLLLFWLVSKVPRTDSSLLFGDLPVEQLRRLLQPANMVS